MFHHAITTNSPQKTIIKMLFSQNPLQKRPSATPGKIT
jgi:hypothetical protein